MKVYQVRWTNCGPSNYLADNLKELLERLALEPKLSERASRIEINDMGDVT